MAADGILYNFGANAGHLEDITGMANAIQEVRGDIQSIFQALSTVYEGDGATALNQAHQEVNNMLDEALNTVVNTQKQAQDQQDAMQAMDKANAAAF
ncbi:hypothetical protein MMAG44476_07206 [Mycolicibacterium mageritense DSM 44476 = CIP 104973]|uniref:ESAT-6-like protein n=1 Tax=Mycolicibacterium mageritense TaxID=53462 RepID=A0AAI8TSR5_MYCME|nr:hypothetical protein [Mycolicibacterium mageritense]MBN3459633.1 hypothetical protein [Mycobacterium sp. DSM 3803]OKH73163.1 hypothetical protein EB73_07720 [Mycobacterium sp. SWH-M3]MCC9184048.1 hypothetical protein [Mycolicibacterium mageritense]TXI52520.1 MAG: hypothetical protein E6Q55_36880 [Mycolicibacterium mageritense]CDO21539.1 hypothetical protein BN978_02003 [Mycolicibacterium mageritense DSM 44476 = CIP 104973]